LSGGAGLSPHRVGSEGLFCPRQPVTKVADRRALTLAALAPRAQSCCDVGRGPALSLFGMVSRAPAAHGLSTAIERAKAGCENIIENSRRFGPGGPDALRAWHGPRLRWPIAHPLPAAVSSGRRCSRETEMCLQQIWEGSDSRRGTRLGWPNASSPLTTHGLLIRWHGIHITETDVAQRASRPALLLADHLLRTAFRLPLLVGDASH